jgi:hypothetical protein
MTTKPWQLRMIGGPYDGWTLPCSERHPPHSHLFHGLPYARDFSSRPTFEDGPIPIPEPIIPVEYHLFFGFEDKGKNIAVYAYIGSDTRRLF